MSQPPMNPSSSFLQPVINGHSDTAKCIICILYTCIYNRIYKYFDPLGLTIQYLITC